MHCKISKLKFLYYKRLFKNCRNLDPEPNPPCYNLYTTQTTLDYLTSSFSGNKSLVEVLSKTPVMPCKVLNHFRFVVNLQYSFLFLFSFFIHIILFFIFFLSISKHVYYITRSLKLCIISAFRNNWLGFFVEDSDTSLILTYMFICCFAGFPAEDSRAAVPEAVHRSPTPWEAAGAPDVPPHL